MTVERLWYEASPYLYVAVGVATAVKAVNPLMTASGVVLLAAAATILGLRWVHRHDDARRGARRLDERRHVSLVTQDLFYDGEPAGARRSDAARKR